MSTHESFIGPQPKVSGPEEAQNLLAAAAETNDSSSRQYVGAGTAGVEHLKLMKDALRQKQKQQKLAVLLGPVRPVVPPNLA